MRIFNVLFAVSMTIGVRSAVANCTSPPEAPDEASAPDDECQPAFGPDQLEAATRALATGPIAAVSCGNYGSGYACTVLWSGGGENWATQCYFTWSARSAIVCSSLRLP
jgi:hypothetical protein